MRSPALLLAALLAGCTGEIRLPPALGGGTAAGIGGTGAGSGTGGGDEPIIGAPVIERSTTRRLSRVEVHRTLENVFGAGVPVSEDQLPEDGNTPFDNDVQEQAPSMRLVEGTETIGIEVADWVVAQPSRLTRISPCATTGDAACFEATAQRLARALWRRPMDAADLADVATLRGHATSGGNFAGAVKMLIRFVLLHPAFLYRTEGGRDGEPQRLAPYEIATRLALMLEGRAPDEALLAAAEAGELDTPEGRRGQAERLMSGAAGKEQQRRFVAMWLGYSKLQTNTLETAMRAESDALVDRAFAGGADYRLLFTSDETFVDASLATHYGLGTGSGWVPYGAANRRGILSHGSFSIAGAKFGDTSPTRRGKFVRERIFCQKMELPTENVDVDQPPKSNDPNACKYDRYVEHRSNTICAGCHAQMDPIGFGLENLDHLGRWRAHDEGRPECVVSGEGTVGGTNGTFVGPKQLADRVAASPRIDMCLASQLMRFEAGRTAQAGDDESARWLGAQLASGGHDVHALLLAYVSHENFALRRVEP
ncbi:MAG: DUF1588 domain-containing protein [Myxococcaceae bacterium]|nr:DUF1588 domain-containing protein [Myxococcaceae bacterium]